MRFLQERRKFEWCPFCKKAENFIDDYCTNIVTQCSFFMPKFRCKEVVDMLKDEILEKIFMHKDIRTVPIGYQATMINIFTDVLNEIKEGNKYAAVYELLTDTNPFLSTDDGDE